MTTNPLPQPLLVEFQSVRFLLPSGVSALDNVSFRFGVGEKIALLGANGSGKTTLALLLAGVLSPSSGFIRWQSTPKPAAVQLLMQNPSLQTLGATVEEELRFGPELLRWQNDRIETTVSDVVQELGLNRSHTLTKLSGGELQQVVGSALRILSPQLLIYDEPAMYLYPPRRQAMIDEALSEPSAVLWLTPSPTEAQKFPRTIVLQNGKLVFDGESANLGKGQEARGERENTGNREQGTGNGEEGIGKRRGVRGDKHSGEAITLRNVTVNGEERVRIDIPELAIHAGERIGIIGDNGSGKTTLLALLGGVLKPDSGEIVRSSKFPLISLAFQFPETAFLTNSIREEIGGPDPTENERIASERLLQFGLEPVAFLNRDPFTLSGGEARRVALAATIHLPDTFLLWDEPTAGLDITGSQAIAEVLTRHPGGFVIAGHDFELIHALCDRIITLENGKVISNVHFPRDNH